jgi:CxxC motif-containing protein (DUF1111 family)
MKPTCWLNVGKVIVCSLTLGLLTGDLGKGSAAEKERQEIARGKELFTREWLAGDSRSHAGDGLGPLYNARSCAACHHLGGIGGAGPKGMNAVIASVFLEQEEPPEVEVFGLKLRGKPKRPQQPDRAKLAEIHPALRTDNSFPFHRFGTQEEFQKWKNKWFPVPPEIGGSRIGFVNSERNPSALFGAGLIDRIPVEVLEEVAASQARAAETILLAPVAPGEPIPHESEIPIGRVARLKDGRIGRFGWKAQTATLREFTLQACATEIGLEVPGFPQAAPPWKASYKAPGLDLSANQCDALVKFVTSLPPPARKPPETDQHASEIAAGKTLFENLRCVVCHQPKVGDVEGIYSDLLLHDMGEELSDHCIYGRSLLVGENAKDGIDPLPVLNSSERVETQKKPKFGASSREWRTPPLWGLRDSAPYLHDGHADTISNAIAQHGGEADYSSRHFLGLSLRERQQLELFLQSLGVPAQERE